MSSFKNTYKLNGLLYLPDKDKLFPNVPIEIIVSKDKTGCTLSIWNESMDVAYTVAFDKILRDLMRA